jgi:hypothetical protein
MARRAVPRLFPADARRRTVNGNVVSRRSRLINAAFRGRSAPESRAEARVNGTRILDEDP